MCLISLRLIHDEYLDVPTAKDTFFLRFDLNLIKANKNELIQ